MCDTCGCNVTSGNEHLVQAGGRHARTPEGREAVSVLQSLLHENDHMAAHNRQHLDTHRALAINLMSSPGAGKTSLLEAGIELLKDKYRCAVVEGDLETENDAERIRRHGIPAVQITTGNACHLDAHMVHDALHRLELDGIDILFIENVGNLICPASFDLGQHRNITLLSVPEGDDKPAKYPVMFRAADLVLVTKTDLLPYLDEFDPARAEKNLRRLASQAPLFHVSSRTGEGMESWVDWLRGEVRDQCKRVEHGETLRPDIRSDGVELHAHRHRPPPSRED